MKITKKKVADLDRLDFLPKHIGNHFAQFENYIYKLADNHVAEYKGGYWEFYELSNGGFYMSLASEESFSFENPNNYCSMQQLDSETISIILNLYALSNFSMMLYQKGIDNDKPAIGYHVLRDYAALEHEHASIIMKAID